MKHFVLGIVLIILGIWGMFAWWDNFGRVMRGLLPFALLGVGLVALLSSYYRFAEQDTGAATDDDAFDEEGGV
jgi:hypothetical protein